MKAWVALGCTGIAIITVALVLVLGNEHTTEAALSPAAFKESPCRQGFDLKIAIHAAPSNGKFVAISTGNELNGIHLSADTSGNGIAERLSQKEKTYTFDKKRCENWERRTLPKLQAVVFENQLKERKGYECINVAEVKYRVGKKNYGSKLCLGSAKQDGMSYGFREFYRGTEFLAW